MQKAFVPETNKVTGTKENCVSNEENLFIWNPVRKRKYFCADWKCHAWYKRPSAPEKLPRGNLSLYTGALGSSQSNLKGLRWLMQKYALRQDDFLICSPPGAFHCNLALAYAELTQREVEYLCLTKDTIPCLARNFLCPRLFLSNTFSFIGTPLSNHWQCRPWSNWVK